MQKRILFQEIEDEFFVLAFDLDALVKGVAHLFELCLCALELASECCILSHDFFILILHAFITSINGFCVRFCLNLVNHVRVDRVHFVRRRNVAWLSHPHQLIITNQRTFVHAAKDVQTCWFPREINLKFFAIEFFSFTFFF